MTAMSRRLICAFAVAVLLSACARTQHARVITACDLIRDPAKWEGKMVTVRGALELRADGAIWGISLSPYLATCRYPDGEFMNASEPTEIRLALPDYHD